MTLAWMVSPCELACMAAPAVAVVIALVAVPRRRVRCPHCGATWRGRQVVYCPRCGRPQ